MPPAFEMRVEWPLAPLPALRAAWKNAGFPMRGAKP
jgi:hypothetical protein